MSYNFRVAPDVPSKWIAEILSSVLTFIPSHNTYLQDTGCGARSSVWEYFFSEPRNHPVCFTPQSPPLHWGLRSRSCRVVYFHPCLTPHATLVEQCSESVESSRKLCKTDQIRVQWLFCWSEKHTSYWKMEYPWNTARGQALPLYKLRCSMFHPSSILLV